jgi:hypothetical protein
MSRELIISEPGAVAICGIRSHNGFIITIPGLIFRYTRATRLSISHGVYANTAPEITSTLDLNQDQIVRETVTNVVGGPHTPLGVSCFLTQ